LALLEKSDRAESAIALPSTF